MAVDAAQGALATHGALARQALAGAARGAARRAAARAWPSVGLVPEHARRGEVGRGGAGRGGAGKIKGDLSVKAKAF